MSVSTPSEYIEKDENIGRNLTSLFFKNKEVLVKHHIDSFNHFIDNKIPEIIEEYNKNNKNIINAEFDPEIDDYRLKYYIKFGKIYISKPIIQENQTIVRQMFPNDARLQNLTYSSTIKVDIYHKLVEKVGKDNQVKETEFTPLLQYPIGKIPMMIQSKYCVLSDVSNLTKSDVGECIYDYGGYFIVNGNEKVIVMQERKAENIIFCFKQGKTSSKFSHKCEISSVHESNPFGVKNVEVKYTSKEGNFGRTFKVKIQGLRQEIPLFVVFRCLGIISDKEICELIFYNLNDSNTKNYLELLRPSIEESQEIQSMQLALEYFSKYLIISANNKWFQSSSKKLWYTKNIIKTELLPHVGDNFRKKGVFLGLMVNKLLQSIIENKYHDRDNFLNKRVDTSGELLAFLFRANFKKMIRDIENMSKNELSKRRFDDLAMGLSKKIKKSTIESGLKYGLSTGNWGLKNQNIPRKGIAQVLNRQSYLSFLSHLRRLQAPIDRTKNSKNTAPRKLHNTQWGIICPSETPEGQPVGMVKNIALTTHVTNGTSSEPIRAYLQELEMEFVEDVNTQSIFNACKIFINGDWVGIHSNPNELVKSLKSYRRQGRINIFISISWNIQDNEILIFTDGGRLCRPVLIVENNKIKLDDKILKKIRDDKLKWSDLLIENEYNECYIEFLDVMEENTCMIALNQNQLIDNKKENERFFNYTHCEIDPTLIVGVICSIIPLFCRNQAPRVAYECAQAKQALGIYATNFENRLDTMGHILYYPQVPLASTYNSNFINFKNIPAGQNAIIAIASHTGYNQEDSIIINQSSLDRGLFNSSYFRTYTAKEQKNQSTLEEEKFCKPERYNPNGTPRTAGMKEGSSYEKIEEDGFAKEGTRVDGGDIIIGKCIPLKTGGDDDIKYRDASTSVKMNENGIVDKVYVNKDGEGFKFAKVRIRSERKPQIGDKFASRHGQKGTCGITYTQEDMPFSKNGTTPDMIINPHAIPSRMTIGQLIECLMGKVGGLKGNMYDASPFTRISADSIGDMLQNDCNFERYGNEVLYNGRTGEQLRVSIFIGPTYYHRLKHMVRDKIHSRSTGPYQLLTRQPAEGRARDGGLRIGEMERDAMLSHGTIQFLKERLFNVSDKYFVNICKETGMIAAVNEKRDIYNGLYSEDDNNFFKVQMIRLTQVQ